MRDVQLAADVLRGVYEDSGGFDGYVSLEVAPRLAHDTDGTLEQARMYWGLVDRPNLMIKIPATPEGIPAIETALYEGMNVNVTLLFGVGPYEDVMRAYIRAMRRRQAEGLPLDRRGKWSPAAEGCGLVATERAGVRSRGSARGEAVRCSHARRERRERSADRGGAPSLAGRGLAVAVGDVCEDQMERAVHREFLPDRGRRLDVMPSYG